MRIEQLVINNFLIHRELDVVLDEMNVFCGMNRSGKTSVRDAVVFALAPEGYKMRGIVHKKDLPRLISSGAKKGSVTVLFNTGAKVSRNVGTGKGNDQTAENLDPKGFVKFITDMRAFPKMNENERRKTLFRLSGIDTDPKTICDLLKEQGLNAGIVDGIQPLLRSGFPEAEKEARIKAREHKASWKAVTGEAYGPEKAEEWKCQVELGSVNDAQQQLKEMDEKCNSEQGKLNELIEERWKHWKAIDDIKTLTARIAELEPVAGMLEERQRRYDKVSADLNRLSDVLNKARKDEKKLESQLSTAPANEEYKVQLAQPDEWYDKCPSCGVELGINDETSSLIYHIRDDRAVRELLEKTRKDNHETQTELTYLRKAATELSEDVNASVSAVARIEECRASLANLKNAGQANDKEIDDMESSVKTIREHVEGLRAKIKEDNVACQTLIRAEAYHRSVKEYLALADALSPTGIQKQLLDEAMGPINKTLADQSDAARFPRVRINDDMTIMIGGMPYQSESESMQWRVDAILSVSFAILSGLGFVVLDRLDVLDTSGRRKAVAWLYGIKENVQSIVMATLKEVPTEKDGMQVVWLEGSVV